MVWTFGGAAPATLTKQVDPNFRQLNAVLARLEPDLRNAILQALRNLKGTLDIAALRRALEQGNVAAVEAVIDWAALGASLLDGLEPAQRRALAAGGRQAVRAIPGTVEAVFAIDDILVTAWLAQHGAELVRDVTENTRAGLRTVLERMFAAERPLGTREAALQIRDIVGLTRQQANAVANFRNALTEAQAGERTLNSIRGQFSLTRDVRMPTAGLRPNQINRLARDYAARLLTHRTTTIAEHEAMKAMSQGRQLAWNQFVAQGAIDPDVDLKEWLATPDERTCEICLPMHGQTVPVRDGLFTTGEGVKVEGPPAHVGCRCDTKLSTPEQQRPSAARRRTDERIGELQAELPEQPLAPV